MASEHIVIIGAGIAGARLAEALRRKGFAGPITLLGGEAVAPYNRVMLSPLLAGECGEADVQLYDAEWYAEARVRLLTTTAAERIELAPRYVQCSNGRTIRYDRLVFATGAVAAEPKIPGCDLPGVGVFRDWADVGRLAALVPGTPVAVLGGGLLGVEAAAALAARGADVTLVHRSPWLLNRQLDAGAGRLLRIELERRGIAVKCGVTPTSIEGTEWAERVRLADGTAVAAQHVVLATGIRPNTSLAAAAGLAVGRGIRTDSALRTTDPSVYAIGECAEVGGCTVGLVAPIVEQVEVLAATLAGSAATWSLKPYVTALKVGGIDVHVMGDTDDEGATSVRCEDTVAGVYRRLWFREGCIAGALLYGDVSDSRRFFDMIQTRQPVTTDRCRLLLAGPPQAQEVSEEPLLACG